MTSWLDLEQKRFRPIQEGYGRRYRVRMTAYLEEVDGRIARARIGFPQETWATEEAEDLFVEAAKKGGWMLKEDNRLDLPKELRAELGSGTSPLEWWFKAIVLLADNSFIDKEVCCDPPDDICTVRWKILQPIESSLELCEKLDQMARAGADLLWQEWAAEIEEEWAKKQDHAPVGVDDSVTEPPVEPETVPSAEEPEDEKESSEISGRGRRKDEELATITEYLHRAGIRSPGDLKYSMKLRKAYMVMDEDGIGVRGGTNKWVDLLDKSDFKEEGKRVKDALRKHLERIRKKP